MEYTISRHNAQHNLCADCALLRDVWGWGQVEITA